MPYNSLLYLSRFDKVIQTNVNFLLVFKLYNNIQHLRQYMPDPIAEPQREDRRLDTLARLLEGEGPCTAVSIYNGELIIAANKVHAKSRNSELSSMISESLKYFASVTADPGISDPAILAGDEEMPKKAFEILKDICIRSCKALGFQPNTRPQEEVGALIEEILKAESGALRSLKEIDIKIEELNKVSYLHNKYDPVGGGEMSVVIHRVYSRTRDFFKLVRTLQSAELTPIKSVMHALKVSDDASAPLKQGGLEMHAEMRIMDSILRTGDDVSVSEIENVYIGISKLCCVKCYTAIKAVNESSRKIVIEDIDEQDAKALSEAETASERASSPATTLRSHSSLAEAGARAAGTDPSSDSSPTNPTSTEPETSSPDIKSQDLAESRDPIVRLFEIRGTHHIDFVKWEEPAFLKTGDIKDIFDRLIEEREVVSGKRGMCAPASVSSLARSEGVADIYLGGIPDGELISRLESILGDSNGHIAALKRVLASAPKKPLTSIPTQGIIDELEKRYGMIGELENLKSSMSVSEPVVGDKRPASPIGSAVKRLAGQRSSYDGGVSAGSPVVGGGGRQYI